MSQNSDCLECRLIGSGSLLCLGLYLIHCSQKFQNFNRLFLLGLGPGVITLGFLRFFNLPPFKHSMNSEESTNDITQQDNYIIGKSPPKFR